MLTATDLSRARALALLRRITGISLRSLAEESGLSVGTVFNAERGLVPSQTFEKVDLGLKLAMIRQILSSQHIPKSEVGSLATPP